MNWIVGKAVEWWLIPSWYVRAGMVVTGLALLSVLVSGIVKAARLMARGWNWVAEREHRAPLEGLTAGGPLPTPHFTGREEEKRLLAGLIENQHVCAVAGPPLIGKSWLISKVIRSGGREQKCIFIELKQGRGLSALLFAINAGLVRLDCHDFDAICRSDDLTWDEKAQTLRQLLEEEEEEEWVIVLDAYERVTGGIDQTIEGWATNIGGSRVVLGTRRTPAWLKEGRALDVPPMPAADMEGLCITFGVSAEGAKEVCGELAGLPGAPGLFRGVLDQKSPKAARKLLSKKPEKLGRRLFDAAFKAAPQAAQDVWMVASWFPQPLTREAAFAISGEQVFEEGVSLLERWTVLTEGSERLDLHAWATRTGERALRWLALPWHWNKQRIWGQRAARYFAAFAVTKREDRAAIEGELENVMEGARLAFRHGEWEALWGMGYALGERLDWYGRWAAQRELFELCIDGARRAAKADMTALFLHNRGIAAQNQGRLEEAEEFYRQSLEIKQEVGDRPGEAQTLHQLGTVAQMRGKLEEAEGLYQESLEIAREVGDRPGEAYTLGQLGNLALSRGDLDVAEERYKEVRRAAREMGDRPSEAKALHQLGMVAQHRGKLEEAEDRYNESLKIKREVGDRPGEAKTLHQLGRVAEERGKLEEAEGLYTQARDAFQAIGDRRSLAAVLHQLGRVAQNRGRLEEAEALYQESLDIEREVGNRPGEAQSLAQLALLAEEQGDLRLAAERMEKAAGMFEEMGLGEAERARGDLERLRGALRASEARGER